MTHHPLVSKICERYGGGFFSLSSSKGGEGRGEEADYFKLKSPHPNLSPLERGEGEEKVSLVRIIGEPTSPNEAAALAEEDKYQFQRWARETRLMPLRFAKMVP
jgi:hypothetical protein